jgi:hypothetical protein
MAQLSANVWTAETAATSFVGGTQFKVLATDATPRYLVGRRIRANNTGGTGYYTIVSATYGAPDTLVTVVKDAYPTVSPALDAGLNGVAYGLEVADYSALPKRTDVLLVGATANSTVGVTNTWTAALSFAGFTIVNDFLSEVNGSGQFKNTVAGLYAITGQATFGVSAGTTSIASTIYQLGLRLNGAAPTGAIMSDAWPYANNSVLLHQKSFSALAALAAGTTVDWSALMNFTITAPTARVDWARFQRVN